MDMKAAAASAQPVPDEEFSRRLARLRTEMAKGGVDTLVLTSRENVEYFCSHRTLSWTYNARPVFLVVGADAVQLVAPATEERNVAADRGGNGVVFYTGFLPEAIEVVVAAVGGTNAVAIDYGHEFLGRGSLALVDQLARIARVTEAGDTVWNVRVIKSDFEIDLLRTTFRIANSAFDRVIASVCTGITEIDLFRALQVELIKDGADRVDPFSVLFGKNGFRYSRPPSARTLAQDDYVWTDFRSSFGGYPADRNRIARAGEPSPREIERYGAVRAVTVQLAEDIAPGMTCGEVYQHFVQLWREAGLKEVYAEAGRIGHGGGMGLTEPPSITAGSTEVVQAGMVLHLEPKLEEELGVFQFEEVIAVRDGQNVFLSALSPAQLPIVGTDR
jgi:Xaa-Pro aminopeptidase